MTDNEVQNRLCIALIRNKRVWQHHKDARSHFILNTQKVKHQRANTHTNALRLKRHLVKSEKQTQRSLRSEIYSHFRMSDICSPVQINCPCQCLVFECVYSLVCPLCTVCTCSVSWYGCDYLFEKLRWYAICQYLCVSFAMRVP